MNYEEKAVEKVEEIRTKIKEMIEFRGKDHPTNNFERPKLDALNVLVSCTNAWISLEKFFQEDTEIKPYYEEARDEAWRDNCQSASVIMIMTIRKLLERIDE